MSEFGKGSELLYLETVQRAIDESAAWAGNEFAMRLRGQSRYLVGKDYKAFGAGEVESPIEAMFLTWFNAFNAVEADEVYEFQLIPQYVVEIEGYQYRFDFIVHFLARLTLEQSKKVGIDPPRVAIELDGHDFHERTKEQVAKRNIRDRHAQGAGWTILHFSGSELHRDPLACVSGAREIFQSKHDEWANKVWDSPEP